MCLSTNTLCIHIRIRLAVGCPAFLLASYYKSTTPAGSANPYYRPVPLDLKASPKSLLKKSHLFKQEVYKFYLSL